MAAPGGPTGHTATPTASPAASDGTVDCDHYRVRIGPYLKCTRCGDLTTVVPTDPECDDCDFETHRCRLCEQVLDHSEVHWCPKAVGK